MKRVLLLLADGVEAYEASAYADVFGWANVYGDEPIDVVTAGLRREITCTFFLKIIPDELLENISVNDFDALAIPGGFERAGFYEEAYDERFLQIIRNFDAQKKLIGSICVGALPIAKSGVLKGRNATTYNLDDGKRCQQLAELGAKVVNTTFSIDENIITVSSPAMALESAFALLSMLTSCANMVKIKRLMGYAA